jgi:hypothetical protein
MRRRNETASVYISLMFTSWKQDTITTKKSQQNNYLYDFECTAPFYHPPHTKFGADHSGSAVYGMNSLRLFEPWDRGFESHSMHRCLYVFILCLCCSVCDRLILRLKNPTDCVYDQETEKSVKDQ